MRGFLSRGADEIAFSGNKKVEGKGSRDTFSASQLPMSFIDFCKLTQGTTKHVKSFCLWGSVLWGSLRRGSLGKWNTRLTSPSLASIPGPGGQQ